MKVLALELSSSLGSVAFHDGDGAVVVRQFPADRKHSGFFYENLRAIHQENGPANVIAIGLGPGSYAGIRIAIATAFGLRAASGARLVGLPSICAIDYSEYCVVGDARRNSFFFAHVIGGRCDEGPVLATEEEVRAKIDKHRHLPILASQPLSQFEEILVAHPSALVLAQLAEKAKAETEGTLEPIYLREPYITTPNATPWIR
jgi:tRNA threonylcarbamoyladenosine biosynthesis protein TsaB